MFRTTHKQNTDTHLTHFQRESTRKHGAVFRFGS